MKKVQTRGRSISVESHGARDITYTSNVHNPWRMQWRIQWRGFNLQ